MTPSWQTQHRRAGCRAGCLSRGWEGTDIGLHAGPGCPWAGHMPRAVEHSQPGARQLHHLPSPSAGTPTRHTRETCWLPGHGVTRGCDPRYLSGCRAFHVSGTVESKSTVHATHSHLQIQHDPNPNACGLFLRSEKTMPKCTEKHKRPRRAKAVFKNKSQVEGIAIPACETDCGTAIMQRGWYGNRTETQTEQQKRCLHYTCYKNQL